MSATDTLDFVRVFISIHTTGHYHHHHCQMMSPRALLASINLEIYNWLTVTNVFFSNMLMLNIYLISSSGAPKMFDLHHYYRNVR